MGGKTRQSSLDSSERLSTGRGFPDGMPTIQTSAPGLSRAAAAGFDPQLRTAVTLESARDRTSSLIVPRRAPVAPSEELARYFPLPRSTLPAAESSVLRAGARFVVPADGVAPRADGESAEQPTVSRVASRAAKNLVEIEAVTE